MFQCSYFLSSENTEIPSRTNLLRSNISSFCLMITRLGISRISHLYFLQTQFYFFEPIWILRNLLLAVTSSTFDPTDPAYKTIISTILGASLILNQLYHDRLFKHAAENALYTIVLTVLTLTFVTPQANMRYTAQFSDWMVLIIQLLAIGCVILATVYHLLRNLVAKWRRRKLKRAHIN